MANQGNSEIKYLTPITVDVKKKKYCRFKKSGIKYIDYKDADFLLKFITRQDPSTPDHRYQYQVPAQGCPGDQACPPPGFITLRC